MSRSYETYKGPIDGLCLPTAAWVALRRENIGTIEQLKVISGWLELFDGIEPKTAQAIRLELARVAPPEGHTSDKAPVRVGTTARKADPESV
jgi:hypothetical protein